MIGRGHRQPPVDLRQLLGRDEEIVVAGQKDAFVRQTLIARQHRVEILIAAVDEIAERHDEGEIVGVEDADRLVELAEALLEVTVESRIGRQRRVLRVGNDAETNEGGITGHAEGSVRGIVRAHRPAEFNSRVTPGCAWGAWGLHRHPGIWKIDRIHA